MNENMECIYMQVYEVKWWAYGQRVICLWVWYKGNASLFQPKYRHVLGKGSYLLQFFSNFQLSLYFICTPEGVFRVRNL